MSKSTSIQVEERDFSKTPKQLRASGKVPATIYGHNFDSISIQVDTKAFQNAYKGDKTAILELDVAKNTYSALVKNIHNHPVDDRILNVEFYRVNTDEKLKVAVPVELVGEAPGVKFGGLLLTNLTEIEVECLPKDIPSSIKIELSRLENLEDAITIKDVIYPAGVTPVTASSTLVVKVSSPKAEKEAPAQSEEVAELTQS